MGLKCKIIIASGTLFTLLAVILTSVVGSSMYDNEQEHIKFAMENNISSGNRLIANWIENKIAIFNGMTEALKKEQSDDTIIGILTQNNIAGSFFNTFASFEGRTRDVKRPKEIRYEDPTGKLWFKNSINSNDIVMLEPVFGKAAQSLVVQISKRVTLSNGTVGVVASSIKLSRLNQFVSLIRPVGE